jgi:mono/diheme cytochrome c family protein
MRSILNAAVRAGLQAGAVVLIGATAGCQHYPPPTPLDQLTAQQAHGHAVFQAHCAVCHYDRRDQSLHGPSLESLYKRGYLQSGAPANDDRVTATILHGRGMMPPMGNQLDPQDLSDLLAYLHTL